MAWIRSVLFYAAAWAQSLGIAAAILTVGRFLRWRGRYRLFKLWSVVNRLLLCALCGLKVRIVGDEHLPPPPFVIVSNHQSAWEILVFGSVFPPFAWVAKESLLRVPLVGWAFGRLEPIAIDRAKKGDALRDVIRQGRAHLARGTCILVFPEGTRSPPGHLGQFQGGAAYLARATGVPAVPVCHNAGDFWPAKHFVIRPGTIHVRVGAPVITLSLGGHDARSLSDHLHAKMKDMINVSTKTRNQL